MLTRNRKRLIVGVLIIIVVVVIVFYFSNRSVSSTPSVQPITVSVAPVVEKVIPKTITAVGKLISPKTITLSAQQAGNIRAIYFTPGERVKKGQLLLKIDDANQKATYQQMQAQYAQAASEYRRYLSMHDQYAESVSAELLNEKKSAMAVAKAQMQAAKVAIQQTAVRAPFSGELTTPDTLNTNIASDAQTNTQLSVGSYLNVGDPIAVLSNSQQLSVQYQIPQRYAKDIRLNQSVTVSVSAYPKKTFHATVSYISPVILQTGSVFVVRARITDSKANQLRSGMRVIAMQTVDPNRKILAISGLSLVPDFNGYTVYQVNHDKIQSKSVTIGERFGPDVAILSGLKAGDAVLIKGMNKVNPGSTVKVVSP